MWFCPNPIFKPPGPHHTVACRCGWRGGLQATGQAACASAVTCFSGSGWLWLSVAGVGGVTSSAWAVGGRVRVEMGMGMSWRGICCLGWMRMRNHPPNLFPIFDKTVAVQGTEYVCGCGMAVLSQIPVWGLVRPASELFCGW